MADNIDQLKGAISNKGGIARGNVYRVFFPSIAGATSEEMNLLCTGVNIPGRQVMTQERKIGLINQKVAYDQAYDDVQLNFLLLNDYGIRQYFETWQNLCINQSTLEIGYLNDYSFDIKIQQLTKGSLGTSSVGGNQIIYECTLKNAFPTSLNMIELGNSREDVMELGVQLSYRNWTSDFGT